MLDTTLKLLSAHYPDGFCVESYDTFDREGFRVRDLGPLHARLRRWKTPPAQDYLQSLVMLKLKEEAQKQGAIGGSFLAMVKGSHINTMGVVWIETPQGARFSVFGQSKAPAQYDPYRLAPKMVQAMPPSSYLGYHRESAPDALLLPSNASMHAKLQAADFGQHLQDVDLLASLRQKAMKDSVIIAVQGSVNSNAICVYPANVAQYPRWLVCASEVAS